MKVYASPITPVEERINAINAEGERIIKLLAKTEFTSLEHMPHEAALIIRESRAEKVES